MAKLPTLVEMLQSGMHFGHQASRWHPKMKQYIFGERGGIHIINLEVTVKKLSDALDYLKEIVSKGGVVMLVGTKRQAQDVFRQVGEETGMPYVNRRWLGGTLTNFGEILRLIKHYKDLKAKREAGELAKYTKKEQLEFGREIEDLERKVGGIANLGRLPEAVFILDLKTEKTAFDEARRMKVPIVAVTDTNVNPDDVAYPIPANDDAVKGIEMIMRLVGEAIREGKEMAAKGAEPKKQAETIAA
ncbi:30S ribosomal protein S2 [Candidatus Uhrbacteria bacterium]|nr:30S ribosomal protein S2 [Candidatus Uhrbacteria bacterium]